MQQYIAAITAIVELLTKADLQQLRHIYFFIKEYVKQD
jgi:hypothetical protein